FSAMVFGKDISAQIYPFFVIGLGVVAFVAFSIWLVWHGVKAFKRATYTIYPRRVGDHEGVWDRQWHTVGFHDGIFGGPTAGARPRTRGAGPVTPTTDPQKIQRSPHLFRLGPQGGTVELHNVPQPKEVWDWTRSIVVAKGGPNKTATADRAGSTAIQDFPPLG